MRKLILIVTIMLISLTTLACQKTRPVKKPEKPLIRMVADVELAKLILRPESVKLDANRDPFKPLGYDQSLATVPIELESDPFRQFKLLGVTKVDNQFRALVTSPTGRDIYQVNDKIGDYVITEITNEQMTLTNDENKTATLKRGD